MNIFIEVKNFALYAETLNIMKQGKYKYFHNKKAF